MYDKNMKWFDLAGNKLNVSKDNSEFVVNEEIIEIDLEEYVRSLYDGDSEIENLRIQTGPWAEIQVTYTKGGFYHYNRFIRSSINNEVVVVGKQTCPGSEWDNMQCADPVSNASFFFEVK
jgi:hypothetical protein